jgi:hypothetical protein
MQSRILGNPEAKPLRALLSPHSVHQSQVIQSGFAGGAAHSWLLSFDASRLATDIAFRDRN